MKQTRIQKHYSNIVVEDFLLIYNCQNVMQLPEMNKAVLSTSSKSFLLDKQNSINSFATCLLVSGQRSALTRAQKSISGFILRKGSVIGCMVTMRKDKMYALLDRIVSFVLPALQGQTAKLKKSTFRNLQLDLAKKGSLYEINTNREALFHRGSKANVKNVPSLQIGVACVQSPSGWLSGEEQRDISFGVKEPTLFPEIESLSGAGALVQKNRAVSAQLAFEMPAYKQTFNALQGFNILLSFCMHKSHKKETASALNRISSKIQGLQTKLDLAMKRSVVLSKGANCIGAQYTHTWLQNKDNHTRFLAEQKKVSSTTTERQKDLLFLSAFQCCLCD